MPREDEPGAKPESGSNLQVHLRLAFQLNRKYLHDAVKSETSDLVDVNAIIILIIY